MTRIAGCGWSSSMTSAEGTRFPELGISEWKVCTTSIESSTEYAICEALRGSWEQYEEEIFDKMQCYTELIPPSAVTHAVSLPFLNAESKSLVVAKTSLLQIFDLKTVVNDEDKDNGSPALPAKSKLVLVGEYPLSGTVTSLASIKALNTKSGGDALLIAFKDAKLSLVEWDPDNYKISTISIHYYEGDNVISEPFGPSLSECESILTVDPSSRCAALKFGARHLAILPFRQLGDELMEGGEDGYDLDVAPESATLKRTQSGLNEVVEAEAKQTPYKASFVLPLTALDPALTHPVDLTFLHEYREPTFGILSATVQPSLALLDARKDILNYTVFSLDLEQRASTNLISTQKLPSDLWKVVPLPLPVGGALLVGNNEFVHVDQSGKTNAVAVNEFAKMASNFGMADQSSLNMKLEGCEIEYLDLKSGDLLIVLSDGSLSILTFKLLGRNVGGIHVTKVAADQGGTVLESAPSCIASFNGKMLFVGSEDGDSALLAWTRPTATLSRKRSHAQMLGQETPVEEDENSEDLDDDDLYATTPEPTKRATSFSGSTADAASGYHFELHDTLPSLGPINNICFGRSASPSKDKLEMLAGIGRGRGSRLTVISKEIVPNVLSSDTFTNARNAWSLSVGGQDAHHRFYGERHGYDNMLFCYDGDSTTVYDIVRATGGGLSDENLNPSKYVERSGTEFEHEGETLCVSTLAKGSRVVQCRRNEIRTYDAKDLSLSQIIPMMDEETDAELRIVHTSFCDPYLLVLRDDSSVQVLRIDESGDIEPLENEGAVKDRKWLSGCLYAGEIFNGETVLFLLGEDGGMSSFSLPNFEPLLSGLQLSHLPAVLSLDLPQRRIGTKETLAEILFADFGFSDAKKPHLILRSSLDDLTLYEPWTPDGEHWRTKLRFRKVPLTHVPKFDETANENDNGRPPPLRPMDVGRYAAVQVPGPQPCLIIKEATTLPKVIGIRASGVKALIPLHHEGCAHGFGILDDSILEECQLPNTCDFSSGWCVQKLTIGNPSQEVRHIAFHEDRAMYVIATCKDVDFHIPEADGRHQEQDGMFASPFVT